MGIQMNAPMIYKHASMRYFAPGEHHVRRHCKDDVLLLVCDGILRFSEDGEEHEVRAGEYYIQKHGLFQGGAIASDSPSYLYVHFRAEHTDDSKALPLTGRFDIETFRPMMEALDRLAHSGATYIEQSAVFFRILSLLYHPPAVRSAVESMRQYIEDRFTEKITLDDLVKRFGYSKNQIILIFRKRYGATPVSFINGLRLQKARHLMESTSMSLHAISELSGFNDYSGFYKVFCQSEHCSPAKWRSTIRKAPTE